jgi:hypothetical protein
MTQGFGLEKNAWSFNTQSQATTTLQLLSPAKCSLMLCRKCSDDDGKAVAQVLNIENTSFDDKYLGLPIPEGRMKNDKFQPSKEKLKKKCSDWSEKYMSGAA